MKFEMKLGVVCSQSLARPDVAERLYVVANSLPDGFGLAIWDAWRDFRLQEALYHAYYDQPGLQPGFARAEDRNCSWRSLQPGDCRAMGTRPPVFQCVRPDRDDGLRFGRPG